MSLERALHPFDLADVDAEPEDLHRIRVASWTPGSGRAFGRHVTADDLVLDHSRG
jgi:hypothetical protein